MQATLSQSDVLRSSEYFSMNLEERDTVWPSELSDV